MTDLICMRCGALLLPSQGAELVASSGQLTCEQCGTVHAHEAAPSSSSDRPLVAGEPVLAEWAGRWWRAELIEPVKDSWQVRFVGWSDEHAQQLDRTQIHDLSGGAPVRRWKLVLALVGIAVLAGVGVLLANKGKLVSSDATAVEADTVLSVGQAVEVERGEVWMAAEVLAVNEDGTVLVRYLDHGLERGPIGDESVARARLRLP